MKISNEFYQFITKIVIPASIGISLKVAIQMRKERISFLSVALSFIIGISSAKIFEPIISDNIPTNYHSMSIAIIAISSEKIGEWFVYKMKIDEFLGAILNAIKEVIIKLIQK